MGRLRDVQNAMLYAQEPKPQHHIIKSVGMGLWPEFEKMTWTEPATTTNDEFQEP